MATALRRTVDVVCALSVFGLVAGILYSANDEVRERQSILAVATDVQRFRQALMTRAAYNGADLNTRGWPSTVDPTWFTNDPPRNMLVTPDRPWVEVATPDEAPLKDPQIRMTINGTLASFWYNPYQGVIRARVPVAINDRKALDLYNAVNGTNLDSIYAPAPPPRAPAAEDKALTASAEPKAEAPADPPPSREIAPDLDPTRPSPMPAPKP